MNVDKILSDVLLAKTMLVKCSGAQRTYALRLLCETLERDRENILSANKTDVKQVSGDSDDAFIDRMVLNDDRFNNMIESIRSIIDLPDIIGEIFDTNEQSSGIVTSKMRVPLGVILMIYESRPNVTIDAAALAIKTGNVIILKGGSEVKHTNKAIGDVIDIALAEAGIPEGAVTVVTDQSRTVTQELLKHDEAIDLVIPRGSRRLLEFVQANTRIPTLLHLEGNCHIYIDSRADAEMAQRIVVDAKTQRFGTCNTAESLLIHQERAAEILPKLANELTAKNVELRGDTMVCEIVKQATPADEADWGKEYLGPIISIKVVNSLDDAISHINTYGSGHTDSIITEDSDNSERFLKEVDSSSVMHNTSTRLADGYEYGLGAEIGISTGKLHARGPVGQVGLTTYKWIVKSNGVTKSGILGKK